MLGVALDLAAVAVTAQIRGDDGVVAREVACDGGPRDAALRRAVQEQHGRPAAADHGVDHGARRLDLLGAKAREELRVDGERLLLRLCGGGRGSRQRDAACDECRGASQQVAPIHTFRGRARSIAVSTHRRPLRFVPVAILARTSYSRTPPRPPNRGSSVTRIRAAVRHCSVAATGLCAIRAGRNRDPRERRSLPSAYRAATGSSCRRCWWRRTVSIRSSCR